MYQTLLLLHLLSVTVLTAGTALGEIVGVMAKKHRTTRELAIIAQFARRVPAMSGIGSLAAMITGSLLVWKMGLGFGAPWVSAAYTLWLIATILSTVVLRRKMLAAGPLLGQAIGAKAEEAPEFQAALLDPTFRMTQRFLAFLTLVFFWLMIYKPGA